MTNLREKISANTSSELVNNVNSSINWIYGMRCADMIKSFCYHNDLKGRGTSEKIIYACSRVVVVYLHKLNEQKHYTQHTSEVSCLTTSTGNFVASGEGNTATPAILVWDINTLKTMCEFRGYHKTDIYLLEFLKNDRHLASCSLRSDTPIFIFDRVKKTVIFSYRVEAVLRGIVPIHLIDFKDPNYPKNSIKIHKNFILFSKSQLLYFKQNNLHSILTLQDTAKFEVLKDITACLSFVFLNQEIQEPLKKDETFSEQRTKNKLCALTGHVDGKLVLWVNMIPKKKIYEFGAQVVDITLLVPYIVLATDDFRVHISGVKLDGIKRTINLERHNFKFHSHRIKNLVKMESDIMLNTYKGDFIKIKIFEQTNKPLFIEVNKPSESEDQLPDSAGDHQNGRNGSENEKLVLKTKEKKLMHLPVIEGQCTSLTMVEKDDERLTFICCAGNVSYGFSSENKDMIDYWTYHGEDEDDELFAIEGALIDEDNILLVYGTTHGKVLFRENWILSDTVFSLDDQIRQLRFSYDLSYLIILTSKGYVYALRQQGGRFETLEGPFELDEEVVTSVNFNEELSDLILSTKSNKMYRISVRNFKVKDELEDTDYINMRRGHFKYSYKLDDEVEEFEDCIILGNDMDFSISSDLVGNMIIYKNSRALQEDCGFYCLGHTSPIVEIKMSLMKNHLMSLGRNDKTLIEWFIEPQISQQKRTMRQSIPTEYKGELGSAEQKLVKREIEFCRGSDVDMHKCLDSLTQMRGNLTKDVNILAYDDDLMFEEDQFVTKRVPEISLKLKHVYGIECFHRRNTLFYLHSYSISENRRREKEKKQKDAERKKFEEVPLHPNYIKEMLFSKYSALPYDKKHFGCTRKYVYFTSRVVVIRNNDGDNVKQRFYEGHRAKISCMAVHPSKMIVATGEAAKHPNIHVWSVIDCSLICKLKTFNTDGVVNLKFSYDGFYLISVGLDHNYVIQVTDWKGKNVISVRSTSTSPILDIAVNPYDRGQFATCGFRQVQTWQVNGRSLELRENIEIPPSINNGSNYLVCLTYIYYLLGDEVITDLVIGNSYGDIGLVTCEKYIIMKKEAHRGMINCLRITDTLSDKLVVVTAGEDEMVKFWDTSFKLIKSYDLRKHHQSSVLKFEKMNLLNLSAQSIDFYACEPSPTLVIGNTKTIGFDKPTPRMLVCTRNGDILEISLTYKFQGTRLNEDAQGLEGDLDDPEKALNTLNTPRSGLREPKLGSELQSGKKRSRVKEFEEDLIDFDQSRVISYHVTQELPNSQNTVFKRLPAISPKHKNSLINTSKPLQKTKNGTQPDSLDLNFSFRKIYFAVKPNRSMMVTAGTNGFLNIWNIKKHRDSHSTLLEALPSYLTFSPDYEYLAVGLRNGKVMIFSDSNKIEFELVEVIENKEENNAHVVRILFSESSNFLAISYLSFDQSDDIYTKQGGYVILYERDSKNEEGFAGGSAEKQKSAYCEIATIWNPNCENRAFKLPFGAYFMSFDKNEEHLIINFQIIDKDLNRDLEDKEKSITVWKIKYQTPETNKDLWKEIKIGKFEFPNNLNARRKVLKKSSNSEDVFEIQKMVVSSIGDFEDWMVMGSADGDLHIIKKSFLYMEDDMAADTLADEHYCHAKDYIAHAAPVDLIQKVGNRLFTTSIYNENIFEWEIVMGKKEWELDHKDYKMDIDDIFLRGIERKEEYLKIVNEMLPLRNEIVELSQNIDSSMQPELCMTLEKIIGRKAFNRRKNLFYTEDNHLVFSAASLIVFMNIPPEGYEINEQNRALFFKENFLEPDSKNYYSISPEISTLTLSKDRKYLCVGTIQSKAKLITWEITSRTYLKSLILDDCCVVLNICYSFDKKSIACVALTKRYTQRVYMVEAATLKILATAELNLSTPIKIKDIEFLPKSSLEFITIGLQHMTHWQMKGECLTFRELPIENPQDIMQSAGVLHILQEREHRTKGGEEYTPVFDEAGNEVFPLDVTFLAVIFLYEKLIVTAGDDGYVSCQILGLSCII